MASQCLLRFSMPACMACTDTAGRTHVGSSHLRQVSHHQRLLTTLCPPQEAAHEFAYS